jgi:hypothetical protein
VSARSPQGSPAGEQLQSDPGAYGLRLPGLRGRPELLTPAPAGWSEWRIALGEGAGAPAEVLEDTHARIRSAPSGWVDVDRRRRSSTLHHPQPPTTAAIAQPFLGSTAIVVAHWGGLHSFHAGAFVAGGKAWAILGSKGDGKSSLLAALALGGTPIVTDDVLVVDTRLYALAGPRCVDLRAPTAAALGVGESLGVVGTRERWRLPLGPVSPEVPLGGWVTLEWGAPAIGPVVPEQRVETLLANVGLRAPTRDPAVLARLMELFALPMVCVRRPKALARLDECAARIHHHLAQLVA